MNEKANLPPECGLPPHICARKVIAAVLMRPFVRLISWFPPVLASLALALFALECRADGELSTANLYGTNFTVSVPNVPPG